jgi:hypothetical protein
MKVLQTLGRHGGAQEGIFQYRRRSQGIEIDGSVGQANLDPARVLITTNEWSQILRAIEQAPQESFRLTGVGPFPAPPNQSLYELLQTTVAHPAGGWAWNDSWKSYVCAILEHEGSIDLYHGVLGQQHSATITLARDIA